MDFLQAVRTRRSIRAFKAEPIPDPVLERVLDLGRYAPSSMNGQPWHFIVVTDGEAKARIAQIKNHHCPPEKAMFRADFLASAPAVVVVCVDQERSYERGIENGVLATATLMLAAAAEGLGSVYMSAYKTGEPGLARDLRDLLAIPGSVDPVNIVPLGYPNEVPPARALRPLQEVVHHGRF